MPTNQMSFQKNSMSTGYHSNTCTKMATWCKFMSTKFQADKNAFYTMLANCPLSSWLLTKSHETKAVASFSIFFAFLSATVTWPPLQGRLTEGERVSTFDLLIKVACLVKKVETLEYKNDLIQTSQYKEVNRS